MNFSKIITIVLIVFVVGLIIVSYLAPDSINLREKTDDLTDKFPVLKDDENKTTIIERSRSSIDDIKSRIIYGSSNRNIPTNVFFCPENNCVLNLINLIENSKESIDCAIYDITLESITEKFIEKADQGLDVRIASDYGRSQGRYSTIGLLKASNVKVITNPTINPYLHHKFCVFDQKKVWVGSMNFTLNGNYKNNNNILVLEDKELAKEYTKKTDAFFEGIFFRPQDPEINIKSFGNVENYFCPEDNCDYHLLRFLDSTKYSLDCMLFSFTLEEAFDIIKNKNINQRFILESRSIDKYSQYNNLVKYEIPVILDKNPNSMHHKFCILDESVVMTGSMNISRNGTFRNEESLIFIYDIEIAKKYTDYFEKYWELWEIN